MYLSCNQPCKIESSYEFICLKSILACCNLQNDCDSGNHISFLPLYIYFTSIVLTIIVLLINVKSITYLFYRLLIVCQFIFLPPVQKLLCSNNSRYQFSSLDESEILGPRFSGTFLTLSFFEINQMKALQKKFNHYNGLPEICSLWIPTDIKN